MQDDRGAGRPRLYVTRRLPDAVEARLATLFAASFNIEDHPRTRAELEAAMREHDAILPTITDRLDADLLALPGRRVGLIANFGAGIEHIDLVAARANGIAVTNTPDALTEATADLAILLMLMTARRAGEGERELRAGRWTGWRPTHMVGRGLGGRTLGLVGYGRIARATGLRAAAFVGLAITEIGLPLVNAAGNLSLSIHYVGADGVLLPLALLVVLVGVAAGLYPAVLLSRFPAAGVLAASRTSATPISASRGAAQSSCRASPRSG